MKIETIRQIVETAKYPTISSAAEATYIRQASLSNLIQKAEAELGYQIFSRTNTGIRLTEKGESFLVHARALLDSYKEIQKLGADMDRDERLTILFNPLSGERFAAEMICRMNVELPNVSIIVRQDFRNHILMRLAGGEFRYAVDYVFSQELDGYIKKAGNLNISVKLLMEDTRYLYVGEDSPLYEKEFVTASDIASVHLVMTPTGEREMETSAVQSHIRKMTILDNSYMLRTAVEGGGMCAISMSNNSEEDWFTKGRKIRKKQIVDEPVTAWHILARPEGLDLSIQERRLLRQLESVFQQG